MERAGAVRDREAGGAKRGIIHIQYSVFYVAAPGKN